MDIGGVCRDAFSAFYDTAFEKYFDGSSLLTPAIHPGTDMDVWSPRSIKREARE